MNICRPCYAKFREEKLDSDRAIIVSKMATALKKVRGNDLGISYSDAMKVFCQKFGGPEQAFAQFGSLTFKVVQEAMDDGAHPKKVELAMSTGMKLLDSLAKVEKDRPPIDLSGLTEEDQRDILIGPARYLALNDQKFRLELLKDPEVRALLKADIENA